MNEPPVRLCCRQRHFGVVCPDGKVMCQLCYSRFGTDQLYVDENGDKWDYCLECAEMEKVVAASIPPPPP